MSKSLLHSLIVNLYPYPCFLNSSLKGASSPCKTLILTFSMVFFLYFFVVDIAPSLTHILLAIMGQNCLLGHKLHYRKISHREVDNTLQNSVEAVALQLPPAPCHCHLSPRLLQWPPNSSPCTHPCPYQLFPTLEKVKIHFSRLGIRSLNRGSRDQRLPGRRVDKRKVIFTPDSQHLHTNAFTHKPRNENYFLDE